MFMIEFKDFLLSKRKSCQDKMKNLESIATFLTITTQTFS